MVDAAVHKPGRIPWCPPGKWKGEVWNKGRLSRSVHGRAEAMVGTTWMNGLEQICQWADDPSWQKQATFVVQAVMNAEKCSQDEAVEKIKKWTAANKKARENEGKEPTDEERFAFHESNFNEEKPDPGVATAKIGAQIPWCDAAGKITDRWDPGRISRTVGAKYGISGTIEGALHLCQRPKDTSWKTEAQFVLQKWMNWTKQSQPDAEASIRARIQIEKFASEQEALCKATEISPELGGEAKAYAVGHRIFFGCNSDKEEMWRGASIGWDERDAVAFYFDADDKLESEIIRLVWLFSQTGDPTANELPSKDASTNARLLEYAVASQDYGAIDMKALGTVTSAAPYNSSYAKAVVNETVSILKWRKKMFDEAVDKLIKQGGDEYASILRDAPKKGFQEWQKISAPWKAELERSRAFEKKLGNPSRKALTGCAAELTPDAQKLIKGYKKTEYNELVNQIASDPIAQLLFSRLAICFAHEKVFGGSGALRDLVTKGRDLRGPRSMAYYAIVDALVEALKDRPKLLLSVQSFYFRTSNLVKAYSNEFNFSGGMPYDAEKTDAKGIVAELKKSGDAMEIVFKKQKYTYPEYDCHDTRKPIRITSDGRIEYEQDCRATGKMLSQDTTPRPVKIHPSLATGVSAGVYVVTNGGDQGVAVYTKKKADDKKIQTFFGFAL
jgi:hypothetical protein